MTLARDLRPGDVIDMSGLIEKYGSDVDEGTRMVAECEMATVEEVSLEESREPQVSEIAVIYSQVCNLAVDADADVPVHHHDPDWDE